MRTDILYALLAVSALLNIAAGIHLLRRRARGGVIDSPHRPRWLDNWHREASTWRKAEGGVRSAECGMRNAEASARFVVEHGTATLNEQALESPDVIQRIERAVRRDIGGGFIHLDELAALALCVVIAATILAALSDLDLLFR